MKHTRNLTYAAITAALYIVLSLLQNLLLPGTTSMAVQFRAAEALCVLALFTPSAIYGLTVGCLLYNLSYAGALPLDFLIGTAATLLSVSGMYALRKVKFGRLPVLSLLMPALCNGLLIGWELTAYFGESPFWFNALCVAAGEVGVLFTLGIALYFALSHGKLNDRLFGR